MGVIYQGSREGGNLHKKGRKKTERKGTMHIKNTGNYKIKRSWGGEWKEKDWNENQ